MERLIGEADSIARGEKKSATMAALFVAEDE
jgi:hypothetical protein